MSRSAIFSAATLFGAVTQLAGWCVDARAQFQAPVNSLMFDDKGTFEATQNDLFKFRDSKNDSWLIKKDPNTELHIESQTDGEYLRPGQTVELTGEINKKNELTEEISELEVLTVKGKPLIGLFKPDSADDPDARPVRVAEPGEYRIRGKLLSIKDGDVLIMAGRTKVTGTLAEELEVKLKLDDPSLAQFGDAMKVKAWYYDQGKPVATANRIGTALAESITITLAKPPVQAKRRLIDRESKSTTKSKSKSN